MELLESWVLLVILEFKEQLETKVQLGQQDK
jgi:hypothetical protein